MNNIIKKCAVSQMVNKALNWDFCPEPASEGILLVRPIVLSLGKLTLEEIEYAVLVAKESGIDILSNGGYPFFDIQLNYLLCGNPKVAAAILKTGMTSFVKSKKPILYPVYFIN